MSVHVRVAVKSMDRVFMQDRVVGEVDREKGGVTPGRERHEKKVTIENTTSSKVCIAVSRGASHFVRLEYVRRVKRV